MTDETPIATTLRICTLDQLAVSPLNPRQGSDVAGIEDLAKSIELIGLAQSLAGLETESGIEIVAGGRRLRALQHLAGAGKTIPEIPVLVTKDADIATAWAVADHSAQQPLSSAEEVRAFRRMKDTGATVTMIAGAFTVTERTVRQRLKLADLPEDVLDALQAGQITLEAAEALTIAQSSAEASAILEEALRNGWGHLSIRRQLERASIASDDRRVIFVGLDAYRAQGGTMTEDLFAREDGAAQLHDPELVDKLFAEGLEALRSDMENRGWAWVHSTVWPSIHQDSKLAKLKEVAADIRPELPEADQQELRRLEALAEELSDEDAILLAELQGRAQPDWSDDLRAKTGCVVLVDGHGEPKIVRGLAEKEKKQKADAANAKPAVSTALSDDIDQLGLLALQRAALDKPELLLDLLGYMLEGSASTFPRLFDIQFGRACKAPDCGDGLFVDDRLTRDYALEEGHGAPTAQSFKDFQERGKKHRNARIAAALAAALNMRSDDFKVVLEELLQPDLRGIWTPDAKTFFGRVRKDALDRIFADILPVPEDGDDHLEERRTAFHELSAKEKAKELEALFSDDDVREAYGLSRAEAARIDAWLPTRLR